MKDARIIELMAGLDGAISPADDIVNMRYDGHADWWLCEDKDTGYGYCIDNYLTDHNAVQRAAEGLSNLDKITASTELVRMATEADVHCTIFILTATPRQKCEAILKAKGLWEVENGHVNVEEINGEGE